MQIGNLIIEWSWNECYFEFDSYSGPSLQLGPLWIWWVCG